jgi:hypothetical protein
LTNSQAETTIATKFGGKPLDLYFQQDYYANIFGGTKNGGN